MPHPPAPSIREFLVQDTEQVVQLWSACGLTRPWNDPRADITRKLTTQPDLFLVMETQGSNGAQSIVGSVMAGYDGHRGWMYYLAVDPSSQGQGWGRVLVTEVEGRLEKRGCPKTQLMVRTENRQASGFHRALGYEENEVLVLGKRLIADVSEVGGGH